MLRKTEATLALASEAEHLIFRKEHPEIQRSKGTKKESQFKKHILRICISKTFRTGAEFTLLPQKCCK